MDQLSIPCLPAADSYGTATRIDPLERHRMNVQFALHTAPTLKRAIEMLGGAGGIRLLDVGSGYGAVLSAFAEASDQPQELRLLDCNPVLLAQAAQRARDLGLRAVPHLGAIDQQTLPAHLLDNDVVLSSHTATHLGDLQAGVHRMAQALRPNGLLVVVDVDYCASTATGDAAATECLWHIQRKLRVTDLGAALPRAALASGLYPIDAVPCTDWLQPYVGADAVRKVALGFVGNFHDDDAAKDAWQRIGPSARLVLRRMAHVYQRD